jgi:hypothetical protein
MSAFLANDVESGLFERSYQFSCTRSPKPRGRLVLTSLFRDRFAELIERFEVERQGLFSMLDGLFVGFPPRIAAFERRKTGQIAVGVPMSQRRSRGSRS